MKPKKLNPAKMVLELNRLAKQEIKLVVHNKELANMVMRADQIIKHKDELIDEMTNKIVELKEELQLLKQEQIS